MPQLVMGTFQHGNRSTLKNLITSALRLGYYGFDTAPSYQNEEVLGSIFKELIEGGEVTREGVFLIDKIDGWQMQKSRGHITDYLEEALTKLKVNYLDLLLIHWPFPDYLNETWKSFIEVYNSGRVRAIGLCNVRERHLLPLVEQTGFTPHVIQVERHPLNTLSSLVSLNQELGAVTQAYSPICRMIDKISTSAVITTLAEKYGRSAGQVIMRWHIDSKVVPVFMTKRKARLEEYLGIFNFRLDAHDVELISSLNENYKLFLESRGCPGF